MIMDRLEGRMEIREDREKEFDVFINEKHIDGVYKIEVNNNSIISKNDDVTDKMKEYAVEVSNRKFDEGYIGNYIYKIRKIGMNGKEVTLIESENTIKQLKITIIVTIVIGALGLIMVYIIAKKISETIVKPVSDSFEKQKQFVSDASHELKTPLAVIEANADVLQDKISENKWITYIQNEVQSMNKLVNDLLILARMENINTSNIQKIDLSKEVQMSVSVFESIMYEKKIILETNKISILNMRPNSAYILSKTNNTSNHLQEQEDNINNNKKHKVELFLNNEYKGVYYLGPENVPGDVKY